MSGPPPVVAKFLVSGLDDVLKAMKSIQDAATQTARKSVAAMKATTSEKQKLAEKSARDQVAAAIRGSQMEFAAMAAGFKNLGKIFKQQQAIRERAATEAGKAAKKAADAEIREVDRAAQHKIAAFKKADKIVEAAHVANEKRVQGIRERSASMAGAFAKKQADAAARVQQQIRVEQNRADFEIRRGGGVPSDKMHLSPQARKVLLDSAKGKSPEEARAIAEKARFMRQEAQIERQKRKQSEAEEDAHQKRLLNARMRTAKKAADAEFREIVRGRKKAEEETERRRAQFTKTVGGAGTAAVKSATTIAGRVGSRLASTVTGLGGGFSIEGAVQERLNLERQASLLSVAARTGEHPERIDPKQIVGRAKAASIATGTDATELLSALNAFTAKTGEYKEGEKNLEFFGKVAKSTGASVEDVAKTAGVLRIQNKDLDTASMKNMILSTVMQSRQGSVEFEDVARIGGKLTRSSSAYSGSQAENQAQLLGLSQIAMRTQGTDPAAAGTAIANLSGDALKHSEGVEALLGRKFLNDKGQIEKGKDGIGGFLADIVTASGGSLKRMQGAGFGLQSMKLLQAVAPTFNKAEAEALKAGKTKEEARAAGREAVVKDIQSVTATKYDEADLERDFAEVMKSSAEQFEGAVRQLKTEVAERLLPPLKDLVPVLQRITPVLVQFLEGVTKIASWAANNPFESFAALVTGFFIKELAAAQIGNTIKSIITGAGGAGGTPGAAGVGGLAGAGIGAGVAGQLAVVGYTADQVYGAYTSGTAQGGALAADVAAGGDRGAAAQAQIDAARERGSAGNTAMAVADLASRGLGILTNPLGAAAQLGGEKVSNWLGGSSAFDETKKTIQARATTSSFDDVVKQNQALVESHKAVETSATAAAEALKKVQGASTEPQPPPAKMKPIPQRVAK
jgi:hypothetical protein